MQVVLGSRHARRNNHYRMNIRCQECDHTQPVTIMKETEDEFFLDGINFVRCNNCNMSNLSRHEDDDWEDDDDF